MSWDKERIAQIQLPDPADDDPHPRLLLEGYGIHAGQSFTALFPDGWHEITLEVAWEPTGPACWYISTPGFKGVCPVGPVREGMKTIRQIADEIGVSKTAVSKQNCKPGFAIRFAQKNGKPVCD